MLSSETFKTVVDSAPLVSIDLIILNKNDEILLGKRTNKPAKGFYFTVGGRVFKNESMQIAANRILKDELGLDLQISKEFVGIYEHFYADSIFPNVSTHYVNMAYKIKLDEMNLNSLFKTQHSEYKWVSIKNINLKKNVHDNVKAYFDPSKNRATNLNFQ
jgi:colanic acid biosynthesis protein WcaH